MKIYLDTHVVVWLAEGLVEKLSGAASNAIESSEVEISPMVLVELQYLFEIKRIMKAPLALIDQLQTLVGLKISEYSFAAVARAALLETWTRDPFDRMIVAQARSDGYSGLVTTDERIRGNYSKTIWG